MTQAPRAIAAPWADKTWADMPKWERLCFYLDEHGPTTTGVLGHIRGIGENVRGIRREANHALKDTDWFIDTEKTVLVDERGKRIVNATYSLANRRLENAKQQTEAVIAERRADMRQENERVSHTTPSHSPEPLAGDPRGGAAIAASGLPKDHTTGSRPSSSRWQDRVGVSGAARKADEGRLF